MIQQTLDFDICERKHSGNPASVEANKRAARNKVSDRLRIIEFLKANGTAYSKQVAAAFNVPLHHLSGRWSELKRDGVVEEIEGERIEGCAVMRLRRN